MFVGELLFVARNNTDQQAETQLCLEERYLIQLVVIVPDAFPATFPHFWPMTTSPPHRDDHGVDSCNRVVGY